MDPERQPLLSQLEHPDVRCRGYRPLTNEEVISSHQDAKWRRARFFLVLMFWAIMAMLLSSVAAIVIQSPKCPSPVQMPTVSPVHLNFAPLVTQAMDAARDIDEHGRATEAWML